MRWRLSAFLFWFALAAGIAAAQTSPQQSSLDGWRASLNQTRAALARPDLSAADLARRQEETQAVLTAVLAFREALQPQIAGTAARLNALGTAPDAGGEAPAVAAMRDGLTAELAALTGYSQQADLIATEARQLLAEAASLRSRRLTSALSERTRSVLDPGLWLDLATETRDLVAGLGRVLGGWLRLVESRSGLVSLLLLGGALALLAGIFVLRRLLLGWAGAGGADGAPTPGRKLTRALGMVAAGVGLPLLALLGLRALLAAMDLLPPTVAQIIDSVTIAVLALTTLTSLAAALLSPGRPEWRIAGIATGTARRMATLVDIGAVLVALVALVPGFAAVTATPASYPVAVGGILSVPVAVLVILAARSLIAGRADLSEEERARSARWRILTPLFGTAALVAIVAAIVGYLAFARFLTGQIVWIWVVLGGFVLTAGLVDHLIGRVFGTGRAGGGRLIDGLGFSPSAARQLGVIAAGLAHVLLVLLAILLVAAPWGLDSSAVTSGLGSLLYGFQVGSIRITFSTILIALAVFVAGVGLSRIFQRWLDRRFLPAVSLDVGLKNSIRTAAGYIGVILAALAAAAYAGLDLASIAIVAGALSVGVGFGLQSVVNNFVSGLILLVERPIRTGDWIDVGGVQGTVRRISVRATEIQTFDRASVIIPNSNLISGVVKNMYLRDVSGGIVIPVGVAYGSDPKEVQRALLACATEHPLVAADPAPMVVLQDFGDSALAFELRCFLADIGNGMVVRSDLRFAILDKLGAAGIEIPYPRRDVDIRSWPKDGRPREEAAVPAT